MENQSLREKDTEITLDVAQKWVKKWKDSDGGLTVSGKKIDSFLIPKYSLEKLLAENIDAARAYIGINDEGLQTIMLVGTRKDDKGIYRDLIKGYTPNETKALTDSEGDIYDFNQPNPPGTGDDESPMNE